MSKFTEGPWILKQNDRCLSKDLQVWTKHGYLTGTTVIPIDETRLDGESWIEMRRRTDGDRQKSREEENANVALIAAAPDMYEMLQKILISMECFHGVDTDEIEQLLAKARGEL